LVLDCCFYGIFAENSKSGLPELGCFYWALSENYTVGSRASGFGSGKDVEAGVFE
jgi:hypothetical protein